jgi:outer membrane lipoprotein-sorting protein
MNRHLAGALLALMLLSISGSALAANGTLARIMGLLAQRKHGEAHFAETDYLAILDQPVKSSGVLVYEAPGHLEKRTLKPRPESLVLDGDELTVHRGHRAYRMQVGADPQVAPYVDAIRDTLAGDEQALERVFKVDFTGTLEDWKLQLVPLDAQVARKLSRVQISGARDEIRSIEILEGNGDRSVMTLSAP